MSQTGHSQSNSQGEFILFRNVMLKGLLLFVLVSLLFGFWHPLDHLGRLSFYNHLFPGRQRLPYGDIPERAYNVSLYNIEAMFASHVIAGKPKPPGEYRVILIGDSSTWGYMLPPEDTLAANLNALSLKTRDGREMQFYNLGYPVMSLAKDLLLLSYAMNYQPDLVIWLVTLESFPYDKQLFSPLLQNNPDALKELLNRYPIKLDPNDPSFHQPSFWDRTLPGSRRQLADLIRLQLYGVLWAATGIDQDIPSSFTARQEDLSADQIFHELEPPHLNPSDLAFDVLSAGIKRAAPTPVMIVNEPMFISQGLNSHIRYNYYYPRWAYDDYSQLMKDISSENGWIYLDFWDKIAASEFTNTAVHLSPRGSHQLATLLADALQDLAP